jgi:hypothetical protein
VTRAVPLLEYLDKLEAKAKSAIGGEWSRNSDQVLSDLGPSTPMYDGRLIAESCERSNAEHIVATQPGATLALIAKLRDAVDIVREAVDIALRHPPADVVNRFQDSVISWASIEVPE